MSRKFQVTVNGETFEVEVEEIGGGSRGAATTVGRGAAAPQAPQVPQVPDGAQASPAGTRAAAPAAASAGAATEARRGGAAKSGPVPAGAQTVKAPLPGVILDVKVTAGQSVREGQVLFVLEAMKMENEIVAPASGTVVEVRAQKGTAVEVGEILAVLS